MKLSEELELVRQAEAELRRVEALPHGEKFRHKDERFELNEEFDLHEMAWDLHPRLAERLARAEELLRRSWEHIEDDAFRGELDAFLEES
jgi:hypothetical protein